MTKNTAAEYGRRDTGQLVNMGWCYTEAEDQPAPDQRELASGGRRGVAVGRPSTEIGASVLLSGEAMVTGAILDISPDMLPGIMSGETCC